MTCVTTQKVPQPDATGSAWSPATGSFVRVVTVVEGGPVAGEHRAGAAGVRYQTQNMRPSDT
jgi:hypothetical protein